jgi:hypothetical protein
MVQERTSQAKEQARVPRARRLVAGQIVWHETGAGVGTLVVEAQQIVGKVITRLSSSVTSPDGRFAMEVDPGLGPASGSRKPAWNLRLQILTAERSGASRQRRLLHTSEVRRNAGDREEFRVELPISKLKSLGPAATSAVRFGPNRRAATLAAELKTEGERDFGARLADVDALRQLRSQMRARLVDELSTVSPRDRASGRYVPAGDDIEPVHHQAVVDDVTEILAKDPTPAGPRGGRPRQKPRYTRRTSLVLDEATRAALIGRSRRAKDVSQADLETALGRSLDKPAAVFRLAFPDDPCRPKSGAERCLDDPALPVPPVPGPPNQPGGNVGFQKKKVIAKLFERQASPEDPLEFGDAAASLEPPLTVGGVDDVVRGLVFAPGPADVPSFHDFHDVQLAFEPVWQEALDDKFLDDVDRVYDDVVEGGGTPAITVVNGFLTAPAGGGGGFLSNIFDVFADLNKALLDDVPASVASSVLIGSDEWGALPIALRAELRGLCETMVDLREDIRDALDPGELEDIPDIFNLVDLMRAAQTKESLALRSQLQLFRADAERIVAHGRRLVLETEASAPWGPTHEIIEKLRRQRGVSYPFRYFAASQSERSVNFGIMVTYRQVWTPISYQVGELTNTIPLAPKEVRRFSKRTVTRRKRARQEVETNLVSRREESEDRSRAETEIVARAGTKTTFGLSSTGTFTMGSEGMMGGSASSTTTFQRDAEQHSQALKKEFREAIVKSAQEFKNERKVEITTEDTYEEEVSESGEIQNPNDEIPVTFLFYELQRRYRIAEKIHRLQSVVFVAQEMPSPSAIDAAWLIRHDWILNRCLLDDSFRPALTYVSTTLTSEDVVLRDMREALFRQRKLVEELKEDVAERRVLSGLRYAALQRQIERTAQSADDGGGLFGSIGDAIGGGGVGGQLLSGALDMVTGGDQDASQAAQTREGAARDAFDREKREENELAARLLNAIAGVETMQQQYSERLGDHLRQLTQVERLAGHIVSNILYYMQAIWTYEPDDQRFLRLRHVPVPVFEPDKTARRFTVHPTARVRFDDFPSSRLDAFNMDVSAGILRPPRNPANVATRPLSEVADIGRPLGFVGNYMIFPMYQANPITELMMEPYVTLAEGQYGVADPDPLGNMSLEEFSDYVCCLRKHLDERKAARVAAGQPPERPDPWSVIQPQLREALKRLLGLSLRNNEEVIVPTDSLYIEALPGAHSVMERFKHLHRQIDVKAAQENLRRVGIDNVRRAQRVIDGDLEDPDIEAKYVFDGATAAVVAPPAGPGGGGGN